MKIKTFILLAFIFTHCGSPHSELPYLGEKRMVDGKEINHRIPDWEYTRQDSVKVTNKDLQEYIYITDFFFMSCPTICPKVMKEMLNIYEEFKNDDRVKLVSFTIDPERDTPKKLAQYAANLEVNTDKWWFLNGDKERTFELANEYFVVAYEDKDVPGGFDHSGKIILVDKKGHIRSFSEGTDSSTTPKLIKDIKNLLKTYE